MESVVPPANPKRCADVRASMPLKKKTVINRMANLKKKLKELTILCDTQGFLVCSCPSLGTQVWPEDPEALLSRIQQFKETKKKKSTAPGANGGALMILPATAQAYQWMIERLLIASRQSDEETRLQNLLQCITGRRKIDGFELPELRQILRYVETVRAVAHQGLTETKNKLMEIDLSLKL